MYKAAYKLYIELSSRHECRQTKFRLCFVLQKLKKSFVLTSLCMLQNQSFVQVDLICWNDLKKAFCEILKIKIHPHGVNPHEHKKGKYSENNV